MVIYLQHPVHGTKVATSDLEANYDEKHGWDRVYDNKEPPINSLKKRGRPVKEAN
jgi:hypothetical protein